jgi:hypothetical protein
MEGRDSEVIERREIPRIGVDDDRPIEIGASDPLRTSSRPFARLVASPVARRLVVSRLGRAILGLAVLTVLLIVVGSSLSRNVVGWLHGQEVYRVEFKDIELVPAPPGWIKGGREELLEEVRGGRDDLESFSMLDLKLDALLTDFRRNPWIARADRATTANPKRVTVYLEYREPVAVVQIVQSDQRKRYPIDRGGIVLPGESLDLDHSGDLTKILVSIPLGEPRPGIEWPGEAAEGRSRVILAARLAGFFKERLAEEVSVSQDLKPVKIFANDPNLTGLVVELADRTFVLWTRFHSKQSGDEPTDTEKWDRLKSWSQERKPVIDRLHEYLEFTRDGLAKGRFRERQGGDGP